MTFFFQRRWLTPNFLVPTAVLTLLVSLISIGSAAPLQGQTLEEALLHHLQQEARGNLHVSYHRETGRVRFLGTSAEQAIAQPTQRAGNVAPEVAALAFMEAYGSLFGVDDAATELSLMRSETVENGRSFTRFQQMHQDVPVIGGEIIVQTNNQRAVVSVNGEALPNLTLDTQAAIGAETAVSTALEKIAKDYGLETSALSASEPERWIYNPQILGGPGLPLSKLVWRLDVMAVDLAPIRELVLIDAQTGAVVLNFNQIAFARNRIHHDNNNNPSLNLPGNGPVRTEGQGPTGVADIDLAYDFTGHTYNFLRDHHGRDSLDNQGMALISTTRYCPSADACPFGNAFWNGEQMVYGAGFSAADDVVAHELAHGFTNFTSDLFYWFQSGAINESLSDVWGEFVDLTNGAGNDAPNVRWLIGEDLPPSVGAIRSMKNPPDFNDPDRMRSPIYLCEQTTFNLPGHDNGGVHVNSGVNNKAVFLMTDGGSFNGQNVTGIGIANVADLYYEVQTKMLTSAADYADLNDALLQASINLGFSANERQSVQNALNAVEMAQDPVSCPATEAPMCSSNQLPIAIFQDDFETSSGNWLVTNSPIIWGLSAFYASSGTTHLFGQNAPSATDGSVFMSSDLNLPANAFLHFNHSHGFETGLAGTVFDGGVVEYSTNGGNNWTDADSLFTHNGYNATLSSQSNPLNGRSAFGGDSSGYISSRLDLSSLSGQNVRFRFRIGTDGSVMDYGWFVDDVNIYTCHTGGAKDEFAYLPIILGNPFGHLRVINSAGGNVSISLNTLGTTVFTPGTGTWANILPNTYTGTLTAVSGDCAGQSKPVTYTIKARQTLETTVSCGPQNSKGQAVLSVE